MRKIIIDLCGGSGAWSKPYQEAGYSVDLITLPENDVTKVEFATHALKFKDLKSPNNFCATTILYEDIVAILAAPPCAEFSIAKGNRPRDLDKGMKTVKACMEIIWEVRKRAALQFWALENPRGLLRQFLGIPKYTFEQWQFGGDKRKATDIWGYFKEPTPTVKEFSPDLARNDGKKRVHAADWTSSTIYPPEYADYIKQFHGDDRRAAVRAITPKGFAEAFYRANKPKGGKKQ